MYTHKETTDYVASISEYCMKTYGVIKESWKPLLHLIGEEYDTYLSACDTIAATGLVVQSSRGMSPNPAIKIKNDALIQVQKLANELGVTPKQEIKLKTSEPKDNTEDFLEALTK